jgi:hypothetical protein
MNSFGGILLFLVVAGLVAVGSHYLGRFLGKRLKETK